MSSLFDFDRKPDSYGVMGNPIAHSKSPRIHAAFAQQTKQLITYDAILVDPGGLAQAVGNFQANGGKGLNITVPFKQDAWRLMDELSARAKRAGAVNTIVIRDDGSLYGDNTDGAGLLRDICQNHQSTIKDKHILLLGAGGAARGVLTPILNELPEKLVIANRTVDTAISLANDFSDLGNISACGFPELEGQGFDLIINGTSASLQGGLPPLPSGIINEGGWCYDMMYSSESTPFLRWGETEGAGKTIDGLGMLVEQAAESFYLWRDIRPETQVLINTLKQEMGYSDL